MRSIEERRWGAGGEGLGVLGQPPERVSGGLPGFFHDHADTRMMRFMRLRLTVVPSARSASQSFLAP